MKQFVFCLLFSLTTLLSCSKESVTTNHPIVGDWTYLDEYIYDFGSLKVTTSEGNVWVTYSNKGYYTKYGESLVSTSSRYVVEGEILKIYSASDKTQYDIFNIQQLSADSLILEKKESRYRRIRTRYCRR